MKTLCADLEALMPVPFTYPEGIVTGPCACGSWPGGACLRCAPVNFFTADQVREAMQAATERSAQESRAAEWGEYMAKGAEALLNAIVLETEARFAFEAMCTGKTDEALRRATESLGEFMVGLRSDIHEFRKRVEQDRAASMHEGGGS